MASNIEFYEKSRIIRLLQNTLNQINQECFGENLSVTENGNFVTVKTQGLFVANYDTQKLWDALENYDQEDCVKFDNLWDYLEHCKYTPENQESENKALTINELVEELETKNEILRDKNRELEQNKEYNQTWIDNLNQRVHDLECTIYLLQQENKRLKSNQIEQNIPLNF